jgi:hypothetical protein
MRPLLCLALIVTLVGCGGSGRQAVITPGDSRVATMDTLPAADTPAAPVGDVRAMEDLSVADSDPTDALPWIPDEVSQGYDQVDEDLVAIDVPPLPATDCKDIFACFEDCGWNDQNCYGDCIAKATPEGQMAYEALLVCLDAVGYYDCPQWDQECQSESLMKCSDEYYGCFHGDLSCLDMYLCYISCPQEGPGSQECPGQCFGDATVAAQQLWGDLMECLEGSGYTQCPPEDQVCQTETWEPCQPLYQECTHGEFTCQELTSCMGDCYGGSELCFYECYFNGTIDAQNAYSEMTQCIQEACDGWGNQTCTQEAISGPCKDAYDACYY